MLRNKTIQLSNLIDSQVLTKCKLYEKRNQKSTGKNICEVVPRNPLLNHHLILNCIKYSEFIAILLKKNLQSFKPLGSSSDFQIFFSPKSPKKFESTRRLNFCPRDWAAAAFLFLGLYFFAHCVECRGNK